MSLFVKLLDRHLTDFKTMMERIKNVAANQEGRYALAATHWAAISIERLAGRALSEELQKTVRDHATDGLRFVLHIDEAHSLKGNALDVLKELHVGGLGEDDQIPCVVVLTGLGHTKEHINRHPGLTRAGDSATVNMTAMAEPECVESTLRMLAELNPDEGPMPVRQSLANLAAEAAFGWPRHLLSAQKAICEAMIEANGNALALDHGPIKARCAELRAEYYEERMKDLPEYTNHPAAFKRIVSAVPTNPPPRQIDHLAMRCLEEVNKDALVQKTVQEALSIAKAMDESGIVERKDGVWALSIPSMASWASE